MTHFKRLLLSACGLAATASMSAFTVHDLVDETGNQAVGTLYWSQYDAMQEFDPWDFQYDGFPMGLGYGCHFEYVRDTNGNIVNNQVKLVGFRGFTSASTAVSTDFIFVLGNKTTNYQGKAIYEAATDGNGDYLFVEGDIFPAPMGSLDTSENYYLFPGYRRTKEEIKDMYEEWDMELPFYNFSTTSNTAYSPAYITYWAGEIARNAEGNVTVTFPEPVAFVPYRSFLSMYSFSSSQNSNWDKIIDHLDIETFKPNATLECTSYPYVEASGYSPNTYSSTGTAQAFPLKVDFDGKGGISILNLTGNGYARDNDATYRYVPRAVTGGYDIASGKFWLDGGQTMEHLHKQGTYTYRVYDWDLRLASVKYPGTAHSFDNIEGSIEVTGTLAHRVLHNQWVDFGGTLRTYISEGLVTLPAFAYVWYQTPSGQNREQYRSSPAYSGGSLTLNEVDVTLNASLDVTLGKKDDMLWPFVTLHVNANDAFVKEYEVYMLPGSYTHGDVIINEDFNHDNGHTNGILLKTIPASSLASENPSGEGCPKSYKFDKCLFRSQLANPDPNDSYWFYVKAIYREDAQAAPARNPEAVATRATSTLDPTFHGMVEPQISTGIDGIANDLANTLCVTSEPSTIMVNGSEGEVEVFSASGALIYSGLDRRISVAPGVYVVRLGAATTKIAVR